MNAVATQFFVLVLTANAIVPKTLFTTCALQNNVQQLVVAFKLLCFGDQHCLFGLN